jgi:hypothetical protein
MTNEEKLNYILSRLGLLEKELSGDHISMLMIAGYIKRMKDKKIISEGQVDVTGLGENAIALCEEVDWKPSDKNIVDFCKEMVEPEDKEVFVLMLRSMRDNQEEFLKSAVKAVEKKE